MSPMKPSCTINTAKRCENVSGGCSSLVRVLPERSNGYQKKRSLRYEATCWAADLREALVLIFTDVFHPVDNLTIELFLDGNVRHGRCWRGTVPMFLIWRKPDDVTRSNFFDRAAPALRAAATGSNDQSLAQRMRMPCSPRTRLERYAGALNKRGIGGLKIEDRSARCR